MTSALDTFGNKITEGDLVIITKLRHCTNTLYRVTTPYPIRSHVWVKPLQGKDQTDGYVADSFIVRVPEHLGMDLAKIGLWARLGGYWND